MDGNTLPSHADSDRQPIIRTAHVAVDDATPVARLADALGDGPFSLITLFSAPSPEFSALMSAAQSRFRDATVIGCTTAGEISAAGYSSNGIVATAFPADHFASTTLVFDKLHLCESHEMTGDVIRARAALAQTHC